MKEKLTNIALPILFFLIVGSIYIVGTEKGWTSTKTYLLIVDVIVLMTMLAIIDPRKRFEILKQKIRGWTQWVQR